MSSATWARSAGAARCGRSQNPAREASALTGAYLGSEGQDTSAALVLFLLAQCFDGVFTYVGVVTFGIAVEANPIIVALMTHLGHGTGLVGAKLVAGTLGIGLCLREIHGAVAFLAAFYLTVAIAPWAFILLF